MYKTLNEKEKEHYLELAKDLLKGTFTECRDCSIYNGTGYFVSSYKDVNKLDEVAEKTQRTKSFLAREAILLSLDT